VVAAIAGIRRTLIGTEARGKRLPANCPLPRPNWSHALPRPLVIPGVMTLRTLADVRTLLGHLPKETRAKSTWQHVEAELKAAAISGETINVTVPLQMVLSMEGVTCRTQIGMFALG